MNTITYVLSPQVFGFGAYVVLALGHMMSGIEIRSYTQKELAAIYRCHTKTFRRWLSRLRLDLGPNVRRGYTAQQVKIIVDKLGEP
jgi:hypothetical protein